MEKTGVFNAFVAVHTSDCVLNRIGGLLLFFVSLFVCFCFGFFLGQNGSQSIWLRLGDPQDRNRRFLFTFCCEI